jgi:orotidine-5'-phosphate decarboxylase
MSLKDRIAVALDVGSLSEAERLIDELSDHVGYFKIGLEFLMSVGASNIVPYIHALGAKVFLDAKFNDTPDTVFKASRAVADLGVEMFNVHCVGGSKMMQKAVSGSRAKVHGGKSPAVLGVTILTSLDQQDVTDLGFHHGLEMQVYRFAQKAQESGLDGVIASAREVEILKSLVPKCKEDNSDFLLVTPGIRPVWAPKNDQKRTLTPAEAIRLGADIIVVGRPITKPPIEIGTPVNAARVILREIREEVES